MRYINLGFIFTYLYMRAASLAMHCIDDDHNNDDDDDDDDDDERLSFACVFSGETIQRIYRCDRFISLVIILYCKSSVECACSKRTMTIA